MTVTTYLKVFIKSSKCTIRIQNISIYYTSNKMDCVLDFSIYGYLTPELFYIWK